MDRRQDQGTPSSKRWPAETPSTVREISSEEWKGGELCLRLGEQWPEGDNFSKGQPEDTANGGGERGSEDNNPVHALGSSSNGIPSVDRIVHHLGVQQVWCANWNNVDLFVSGFSSGIPFWEEWLRVTLWNQLPCLTKASV